MTQARIAMAEIADRLRAIDRVFMVKDLTMRGRGLDDVVRYYRDSSLGYRVIHSKGGAMHMALTPSGAFNEVGYYGQADAIKALFEASTQRVLELACGNGFNCNYLAARNADIDFFGVDLVEHHVIAAQKRAKGLTNVHYVAANFQTLPFSDDTFDSVFAVEGLCHALNLSWTLKEAARCLRPGGTLIVIDAWRTPGFGKLPSIVRRAASLTEHAMAVGHARQLDEWSSIATNSGFTVFEDRDLTASIMPNVRRFERMATKYFSHPLLARLSARMMPERLVQNSIAGYLLPLTIESGAHTYRLLRLRRK